MKFRHELKYICSEAELQIIEARIKSVCHIDSHAGATGTYQIRSVYFDDVNDTCLHENISGTDPREKIRIRAYNCDSSYISLERKRKERTMTHKHSRRLSLEECNNLIHDKYIDSRLGCMYPKVLVVYERTPYVYEVGNVRITFDRNISSSSNIDDFFNKDALLRPIMPVGKHLLEVKYDEILPDYLYNMMNLGLLQQTAFSKYYLCRKFCL